MLRLTQIQEVVEVCRRVATNGLNNGVNAYIPPLEIDVLKPPCDFLGAVGNPAIFVNEHTHKLLGGIHETWIANRTIAIKDSFLNLNNMEIIGAIVHETGHAFNVAANIENSEANAYIFEIEVLLKLHELGTLQTFGCFRTDIKVFFQSRFDFYRIDMADKPYLAGLVKALQNEEFNQTLSNKEPIFSQIRPYCFFQRPSLRENTSSLEEASYLHN
ncbi:MAG: hypothetical protein H0U73_00190 [Tatlockia sp.]|nr:hypothetical protein [Tatlockia sp.]